MVCTNTNFLFYHKWTQTLLFFLLFIFSHFPMHSRFTVLYISLNLLLSWGDHTVLPMVHMELSGSSFYLSVRIFTGKACVVSPCFTTKAGVSTWGSKTSKQVNRFSFVGTINVLMKWTQMENLWCTEVALEVGSCIHASPVLITWCYPLVQQCSTCTECRNARLFYFGHQKD